VPLEEVVQLVKEQRLMVLMVGGEPRVTEHELARFMDENEGPWSGTEDLEPS
jgi:hypothetical protein